MDPTERAGPEPGVSPGGDQPVPQAGHETSDVSIRGIVRFGIGLGVGTILAAVGMWMLFRVLERRERRVDVPVPPMVAAGLRRTPPEPRLEANPLEPRHRMQAREEAALTTYGWVDRGTGVARIPIGRAMELLVERGLPPSKPVVPAAGDACDARRPENGKRETSNDESADFRRPAPRDVPSARSRRRRLGDAASDPAQRRHRATPRPAAPARPAVPGRGGPHGPPRATTSGSDPSSWSSPTTTARCSAPRS